MPTYTVEFEIEYSGEIEVEADSFAAAREKVERMSAYRLKEYTDEADVRVIHAVMENRCTDRESGGKRCEKEAGHEGEHACPEAMALLGRFGRG